MPRLGSRSRIRTLSIQVPAEASAGDTLSFVVEDQELELILPSGCEPNDVLHIQVEGNNNDDDDDDDDDDDTTAEEKQDECCENAHRSAVSGEDPGASEDERVSAAGKNDHSTTTTTIITLARCGNVISFVRCISAPDTTTTTIDFPASDGTHGMVWPATRLVAEQVSLVPWILSSSSNSGSDRTILEFPHRTILELGSGLGCLGLALASELASYSFFASATQQHQQQQHSRRTISLTLTDCAAALPLLNANIDRNRSAIFSNKDDDGNENKNNNNKGCCVSIDSRVLDWNHYFAHNNNEKGNENEDEGEVPTTLKRYDLIIGSDLLYNVDQIPALVHVVDKLLTKEGGVILLLVRWRKPDLERSFFSLTLHRCNMEWSLVLPSASFPCTLDWEEVGDPNCEKSNRYFGCDVQISAGGGGPPKPLSEITEDDISRMTATEHDAWEMAHTQIYRGRRRRRPPGNLAPQEIGTENVTDDAGGVSRPPHASSPLTTTHAIQEMRNESTHAENSGQVSKKQRIDCE